MQHASPAGFVGVSVLALALAALWAQAQAQAPAPTQPGMKVPSIQAPPATTQAIFDATAPVFSQAPASTVPLRGRAPGSQFLFETNGGIGPLRYELTVQPTTYTQYFSVIGVRTAPGSIEPNRTRTTSEPLVGRRLMAVSFAGLPASQPFPAEIEVYLRVIDGQERRIEKLFIVRLTNSGGPPQLLDVRAGGGRFFSIVALGHSGFSFKEAGSLIETRYVKTGLRYRCVQGFDTCIVEEYGSETVIRVPRLEDQGREVDIRLVNDTAASAWRRITLSDGKTTTTKAVQIPGSIVSVMTEFDGANPENLPGSRNSCDEDYAVWGAIGTPGSVSAQPVNIPVNVSIKSKPAAGSRMKASEPIVYTWTAVAVDYVNFRQPLEYTTYRGKCSSRVMTN